MNKKLFVIYFSIAVSLLTYLLTREDLTPEEIYANTFTLFAAGVDTVSWFIIPHVLTN